jgi:microcystin degradation protein MlrC
MRIAVGGILHESNTFVAKPTSLSEFAGKTDSGDAIFANWSDTHHEVTGFLQGARDYGWEVHPTVVAQATPGGRVAAEAFESLVGELCERLRAAPPLDGMLLAVHGAMVAEGFSDADGEIIRRVREILDPSLPLVVTNDFHTNLTQKARS